MFLDVTRQIKIQPIKCVILEKLSRKKYNNISAISWQSVLLVVETGVPRENHKSLTNFIT
jgi:hypothetical protein